MGLFKKRRYWFCDREREREKRVVFLVMEGCGGRRRGRVERGSRWILFSSFQLLFNDYCCGWWCFSFLLWFLWDFFLMFFFFFPGISGSYTLRVSVVSCCKCGLCYKLHLHLQQDLIDFFFFFGFCFLLLMFISSHATCQGPLVARENTLYCSLSQIVSARGFVYRVIR